MLVIALASIAGAGMWVAAALGLAMLGFQSSIGALNDVVDARTDSIDQPDKPIPAGVVSARSARIVVVVAGAFGLVLSAAFGPAVLAVAIVGYGSGIAYDLFMRRIGLGWLCFAVAFPALLAWVWLAAAASLPPGWAALLPLAALAGPAINLANSLVHPDADERSGLPNPAARLGPRRSIRVLATLQALVFGLGWVTLLIVGDAGSIPIALAAIATILVIAGVAMSARPGSRAREVGWMTQAVALALLGVAWLAAIAAG